MCRYEQVFEQISLTEDQHRVRDYATTFCVFKLRVSIVMLPNGGEYLKLLMDLLTWKYGNYSSPELFDFRRESTGLPNCRIDRLPLGLFVPCGENPVQRDRKTAPV